MLKGIIFIILVLGLFVGYIKYIESRSIFFPTKILDVTPNVVHLDFEDIFLKTPDNIDIHGWLIPHTGNKTILFFHGNGGNISHRLEKIILIRKSAASILIFDYRGYGRSKGRPTEEGIYLDAQAAYDYLVNTRGIEPHDIILYGESLGCAVAIDLASKNEVGGIILEGAFSSGRDMAKALYPYLPISLFFNKFNSIDKIDKVGAPLVFIHSSSDEIVPFDLAKKIYNVANQPKKFVVIRGGHNTAFIDSEELYSESIKSFVESIE